MMHRALSALAVLACLAGPVRADPVAMPVPTLTIYPGDVIRDAMLTEREFSESVIGGAIDSRRALVGKAARRTLLPGKTISESAVEDPRLVSSGSQVRVVFEESGLTITAYAAALQHGRAGDFIKVRNLDSGLTVTGTVLADGTVRVSGG